MSLERTETIMEIDKQLWRLEENIEEARIADKMDLVSLLLEESKSLRRTREQLMNDIL